MVKMKNKKAEEQIEELGIDDDGPVQPEESGPITVEPPKPSSQPMARRYYGQKATQIKFLIPRMKQVFNEQSGMPQIKPGHYTVTLRGNANDSPETLQRLDPTGKGVIYDPDDGRLNIKGNPFLYVIDLEHLICEGSDSDSEFNDVVFEPEMLKSYFIHIAAKELPAPAGTSYKFQPIEKIVDSSKTRKIFWCTRMPTIIFEEVPIGSPMSYDPTKFKRPTLKHGKYLDTAQILQV